MLVGGAPSRVLAHPAHANCATFSDLDFLRRKGTAAVTAWSRADARMRGLRRRRGGGGGRGEARGQRGELTGLRNCTAPSNGAEGW